jgi:glutamate-1-semialdehyde 2,1-aminomutase
VQQVCNERGIVFIIDEVFVGFRLAYGGAQEYFNISGDMVTYGKTLGGGLPIGVVCGKHKWMKRFRDNHPADICFARGTFNSHPHVMASMHEFLRRIDEPDIRNNYESNNRLWDERVMELNRRLVDRQLPVKIVNLSSIWTITYTLPGRYNWMFQYYLRAAGLAISWVGSGRIIMSHNFSVQDYEAVMQAFISAAETMQNDGWWWQHPNLSNKSIKRQILRELLFSRFLQ